MVSKEHAKLELLVDANISVILKWLGIEGRARPERTEYSDPDPEVWRVDRVFRVRRPRRRWIVFEVQRNIDKKKHQSWIGYIASLYREKPDPVDVVVITDSKRVETWARKPIQYGTRHHWAPMVLGPSNVPLSFEEQELKGRPQLGAFCSMIHAKRKRAESLYDLTWTQTKKMLEAGELDEREFRAIFVTLFEASTLEWRRRCLEVDMQKLDVLQEMEERARQRGKEAGLKEGIEKGLEKGIAEGIEEGIRSAIRKVCEKRGFQLTTEHSEYLANCHDRGVLENILERALIAKTFDEIFSV